MTGYGAISHTKGSFQFLATLKTLNGKFLDIQLTLPPVFSPYELAFRRLLAKELKRGKVQLTLQVLSSSPALLYRQAQQLKQRYQQLGGMAEEVGCDFNQLMTLLKLDPMETAPLFALSLNPAEEAQLFSSLRELVALCQASRKKEGEMLSQQLKEKVLALQQLLKRVASQDKKRQQALRQKFLKKWEQLPAPLEPALLPAWIHQQLEKLDIQEEKERLTYHLDFFSQLLLAPPELAGKKMLFLTQEISRELNTLAAKAQEVHLQHLVVEMKELLNQVQEQLQNTL